MSSSSSSLSSLCSPALFDNPCIPAPPCKVNFDFIDDCTLPDLPDPIYDCDPPIPPVFEPPSDEFCPNISGDAGGVNVTVTYLNNNCGSSSSSAAPSGGIIVTKTVGCDFTIGLDLDIPIPLPPCPIFTNKKPPTVEVVFDDKNCQLPTPNTITITPTPSEDCSGPCSFDIDLNLLIPIPKVRCPIFSGSHPVTVASKFESCTTPTNSTLTVTSTPVPGDCKTPDTCEFTIDLDLFIPIPDPPCPKINENQTVTVAPYYTRPGCFNPPNTFRVTTTPVPGNCGTNTPETCQFDFELNLFVPIPTPPCPKFNDGKVGVKTYDNNVNVPQSTLKFIQKPLTGNCNTIEQCEFDIELDLNIPTPIPPCPTIETNVVRTNLFPGSQFQVASMLFGPPQKNSFNDTCYFDVEFNIVIPPIPPFVIFGEAEIIKTKCDAEPELKFVQELKFNDTKKQWEVTLTPRLTLPVFPEIIPGTVTVSGGLGTGEITITGDKCNKEVNLILTLYTSACATGGGGGGGGASSSSPPSNTCSPSNCSGTCPPGQVCSAVGGACECYISAITADNAACDDINFECPANSAVFCPPGSRCNPYTDFE